MKASRKMYEDVAKACSKYHRVSGTSSFQNSSKNSTCDCNTPSCLNCSHFTAQEHCDLDLYDQIADRIR